MAEVIVFDGVCRLCNGWVRFLLARDRHARFRFAAMQGAAGRALLARHGLNPDDPLSFLYCVEDRAYTDTDAMLRVLGSLGGFWKVTALARLVPSAIRDPLYRLVARNRYRWFGKHAHCMMPSPEVETRFLP